MNQVRNRVAAGCCTGVERSGLASRMKLPASSLAALAALVAAACTFHPQAAPARERPAVRLRLRKALDITREIESKARHGAKDELRGIPQAILPEDRCEPEQMRFPLKTDVLRYRTARPWTRHYADRRNLRWVKPIKAPAWPKPADAAEPPGPKGRKDLPPGRSWPGA